MNYGNIKLCGRKYIHDIIGHIFTLYMIVYKYVKNHSFISVLNEIMLFVIVSFVAVYPLVGTTKGIMYLYMFLFLGLVGTFSYRLYKMYQVETSWHYLRKDIHLILLAFVFILIYSPITPVLPWQIVLAISIFFFIIAFIDAMWITFTKKDFNFFAPLASYIVCAIYGVVIVFIYKEVF